jgi:hypothetical protein
MALFDGELESIVKKFAGSEDLDLNNFWHLFFSEVHKDYRIHLEEGFNVFDNKTQQKFKHRLCDNPKGFYETLNELRVGAYLIAKGLKVEYEPTLEGKTPDWLAEGQNGEKIIIDVLTSNNPAYMQKQYEVAGNLIAFGKGLRFGAMLYGTIENADLGAKIFQTLVPKFQLG